MLRAALLPDFKGSRTLLIWGNNSDMALLSHGLLELRCDERPVFKIEGGQGLSALQVQAGRGDWMSRISGSGDALDWVCSPDVLEDCLRRIEPLLTSATGHHYVDAHGGVADQAMISVNEYPDDLRR
jgi:hypothetical protein